VFVRVTVKEPTKVIVLSRLNVVPVHKTSVLSAFSFNRGYFYGAALFAAYRSTVWNYFSNPALPVDIAKMLFIYKVSCLHSTNNDATVR